MQKAAFKRLSLRCYKSDVYFTVRPGFSMLSVSVLCTPLCLSPTFLSSFHPQTTNQPHPCCPTPILPHPSFLVVISVRRQAPPWRKYSSGPFPSRLSSCVSSACALLHVSDQLISRWKYFTAFIFVYFVVFNVFLRWYASNPLRCTNPLTVRPSWTRLCVWKYLEVLWMWECLQGFSPLKNSQ